MPAAQPPDRVRYSIIKRLCDVSRQGVSPDLTVLLDMPVDVSLMRRRPRDRDRFEAALAQADAADVTFHLNVREGFLALAQQEPERWLVVDATIPRREVALLVQERVTGMTSELN